MAKVIASTTVLPPIAWNLSDSDQPGVDDFWGDVPEASSSVASVGDYLVLSGVSKSGAIKSQWLGFSGTSLALITWAMNEQTVLTLTGLSVDLSGLSEALRFEDLFASNDRIDMGYGADYVHAYAGNDTIAGGFGNDTIHGGEGLDTAVFSNRRESYSISILETNTVSVRFEGPIVAIYPPPPTDGTDTLIHMERIQFSDRSVAMDLDSSAGNAARLLAAVFGKDAVKNPRYAGIAISLFDQGLSKDQVSQVALNAVFGANAKSKDVVSLIWKNLTGSTIDDKNLAELSGLIDSKAITAAQLTTKAADLELTAQLTDLVGLSKTGWEYIPYGG